MVNKNAWKRFGDRKVREGILMMSPSLVIFCIFILFPLVYSFFLSFQEWSILNPQKSFIGLDNYQRLLTDERFINAFKNTIEYTVGVVPVGGAASLGLALLVNRKLAGMNFFKALFYLPVIPSMVVISLFWIFLLDPNIGLITYVLRSIHLPVHSWLADPTWAMPTVMIVAVWKNMGYYMIIFLAGLVGIPRELYEAAQIDGAGSWQAFKRITIPLLRPTILFVLVMSMIGSFQVFDQVYVMTSGGPLMTTEVGVFYIYRTAFQKYEMGYASAMGFIFFGITFFLTYIELRYFGYFGEGE